jgi:hypothetical protein
MDDEWPIVHGQLASQPAGAAEKINSISTRASFLLRNPIFALRLAAATGPLLVHGRLAAR